MHIRAQFFIAPLFSANSTAHELNAVAAEHQKNLRADGWRAYALTKHVASDASAFHRFSTGNKQTLESGPAAAGVDVRAELVRFHDRWYRPNNMRLCVLGSQSLDELEQMAKRIFKSLPAEAPTAPRAPIAPPYPPQSEFTQRRVRHVPIENSRTLSLVFQLPPLHLHTDVHPLGFASHLLGHEGNGSFLSWTRERGLALGVGAYAIEVCDDWALFSVDVELTSTGVQLVDEITRTFFRYVGVLRAHSDYLPLWNEYRSLAAMQFRYKDKEDPYDYVSTLAGAMHEYPSAQVLRGAHVPSAEPSPAVNDLLRAALRAINTTSFNMFIAAPGESPVLTERARLLLTKRYPQSLAAILLI